MKISWQNPRRGNKNVHYTVHKGYDYDNYDNRRLQRYHTASRDVSLFLSPFTFFGFLLFAFLVEVTFGFGDAADGPDLVPPRQK